MTTASAIDFTSTPVRRQSLWRYWRGGLQGSEFTWAVAFIVPYVAVFLAFVIYPAFYGLWMGSNPSLNAEVRLLSAWTAAALTCGSSVCSLPSGVIRSLPP